MTKAVESPPPGHGRPLRRRGRGRCRASALRQAREYVARSLDGASAGGRGDRLAIERRLGAHDEAVFIFLFASGTLEVVDLEQEDYVRISELLRKYADFPLGTVDASVMAVAERLGIAEILSIDHRHFTTVRPRHVRAFTLLPE